MEFARYAKYCWYYTLMLRNTLSMSLLGMLNIVGTIQSTPPTILLFCLLGMLNIVGTIPKP